MNTWQDEVHLNDVIVLGDKLELLKEQLQENLISYLETVVACDHHESYLYDGVIDTACQIVVDTFKELLV